VSLVEANGGGGTGAGCVVLDHETAAKNPPPVPIGPEPGDATPSVTGSFEEVYRASYGRMVRTAHLLTGSNEIAEEVVQDAFVRLYPRFDTVQDPTGYLYRSVVNGCWAGHRRRRVFERLRPQPRPGEVGPPEIDETWTTLRRLPPRRRAVIVLRFYADLPIADIAHVLDCPTGTVKSLLHRSLAQLKTALGQ
jgi:RNA polymerase sigma factor (sigma-70 family)